MEQHICAHPRDLRPDLQVGDSMSAAAFEQYQHLAVFPRYRRGRRTAVDKLAPIEAAVERLASPMERDTLAALVHEASTWFRVQDDLVHELLPHMPEEALLHIDVTVAETGAVGAPRLHVALSSKWSLRTGRAQDCVSQGAKLVAQRRGRMPHFAVVMMEPRPSMLKILGDGSGSVDCVYHLDLPSLKQTMENLASDPGAGSAPGLPCRRSGAWSLNVACATTTSWSRKSSDCLRPARRDCGLLLCQGAAGRRVVTSARSAW